MEPMKSIKEVAKELNCSYQTVWRRIKSGKIKAVYIGRNPKVSVEELERVKTHGA